MLLKARPAPCKERLFCEPRWKMLMLLLPCLLLLLLPPEEVEQWAQLLDPARFQELIHQHPAAVTPAEETTATTTAVPSWVADGLSAAAANMAVEALRGRSRSLRGRGRGGRRRPGSGGALWSEVPRGGPSRGDESGRGSRQAVMGEEQWGLMEELAPYLDLNLVS